MSKLAALPMKYPNDDDTQPSLRGASIPQSMKVRFVCASFIAAELPPFPYVASGVTPHGLIFTAIVIAKTPDEAMREISDKFDDPTFQSIDVGVDDFNETDIIPGARIYGTIAQPKKRSFLTRWFS